MGFLGIRLGPDLLVRLAFSGKGVHFMEPRRCER